MFKESKSHIISLFGFKNKFFSFSYKIFFSVLLLQIGIIVLSLFLRYVLDYYSQQKLSKMTYNSEHIVSFIFVSLGESFFDLVTDSVGFCKKSIFSFFASFFSLLFFYNCASLVPHMEEINKDLNACVAFAIFGFLVVQYFAIQKTGWHYFKHWGSFIFPLSSSSSNLKKGILSFFSIVGNLVISILLLPFTLLEKGSFLFALSFRLFGNLFGGSIVIHLFEKLQRASIWYYIGTSVVGLQLLMFFYFGLFEGLLQAFIFTLILMNSFGGLVAHE
jgi:F-type H+-transporting ATPase subunit a